MELTDEQRQRIAENRARAMEKRKAKELERASESNPTSPAAVVSPPSHNGVYGYVPNPSSEEKSRGVGEEEGDDRIGEDEEGGEKPGCELCGTQEIEQNYWTIWEVPICRKCGRTSNDYELLNKTDASKEYLIPDDTLKFIPYMEKVNPRHTEWAPMKLYMRRIVKAASMDRWGSEEGLADERLRRETSKMQRDLVKMKEGVQGPHHGVRDKRSTHNEFEVDDSESFNDAKVEYEVFEKMFGDMDSSSLYVGNIPEQQEQKQQEGNEKEEEEKVEIKQEPPKKKTKRNKFAGMVYQKPNKGKKGTGDGSPVAAPKKKKNALSGMIGAIRGKK